MNLWFFVFAIHIYMASVHEHLSHRSTKISFKHSFTVFYFIFFLKSCSLIGSVLKASFNCFVKDVFILWCLILLADLPPNFSVKINDSDHIRLSFVKVASNVMDMLAIPNLTAGYKVRLSLPKEKMDPILQPITASRSQSHPDGTKFRFPNLQRLQVCWNCLNTGTSCEILACLKPAHGSCSAVHWHC